MKRPVIAGLAAGLFIALHLLAGCTQEPTGGGQSTAAPAPNRSGESSERFMTYGQLVEEYERTRVELPLPDGYSYPPFPGGYDTSAAYEELYGAAIAFSYYECSWEVEWLAARSTDQSRAEAALTRLVELPRHEVFRRTYDTDLQAHYRSIIEKASLGDPTGVQETVTANCAGPPPS